MLKPADIESKQFRVVRLREGYAQQEVDDFLDEIVVSYQQVHAELMGLRRSREAITQPIPAQVDSEVIQASRLLRVAEETARQESEEIIARARTEATEIVAEATREKHAVVGELEERKERLGARLNEISSVHGEVMRKMQTALDTLKGE